MYFLAIEITRRRLASVISRLALRALGFAARTSCVLTSFRLLQRQYHARLQVDQLLLQFLHGRNVTLDVSCCSRCGRPPRSTTHCRLVSLPREAAR